MAFCDPALECRVASTLLPKAVTSTPRQRTECQPLNGRCRKVQHSVWIRSKEEVRGCRLPLTLWPWLLLLCQAMWDLGRGQRGGWERRQLAGYHLCSADSVPAKSGLSGQCSPLPAVLGWPTALNLVPQVVTNERRVSPARGRWSLGTEKQRGGQWGGFG